MRLRRLDAGATPATQASSCVEPGGPTDGARVAGKALMASGASSVEATTRRSAPANPSDPGPVRRPTVTSHTREMAIAAAALGVPLYRDLDAIVSEWDRAEVDSLTA